MRTRHHGKEDRILTETATTRSIVTAGRLAGARGISTVKASHVQEEELLVTQRKNRPTSPHLAIYSKQLTFVMSALHRLTGVAMGGAFYALTCGYAATTLLNIPFDAATLVGAFAGLPLAAKIAAKGVMAYPFVYHAFNGVRHLVWDTARGLTLPGVYRTGYTVIGITVVLGSYLTFF